MLKIFITNYFDIFHRQLEYFLMEKVFPVNYLNLNVSNFTENMQIYINYPK